MTTIKRSKFIEKTFGLNVFSIYICGRKCELLHSNDFMLFIIKVIHY